MILFSSLSTHNIFDMGYDENYKKAVPFSSLNNNNTITLFEIGLENDSSKAHWGPAIRDLYIIHYIIQGSGYFNGQLVSKGQCFVIGKNQLHEYHSNENDPWKYCWMLFNGNEKELERIFNSVNIKLENSVYDITFLPELLHFIEVNLYQPIKTLSPAKALSLFYSIISFHESSIEKYSHVSPVDLHINDAILYIDSFFYKDIKITDIAKSIYVNDRYLYNIFKKRLKISPKEYLNYVRISRACSMLVTTSLSISSISNSVGYPNALAFSQFFKKFVGLSPSQYRKINRGSSITSEDIAKTLFLHINDIKQ